MSNIRKLFDQIQADVDFAAEHGFDRVDIHFDIINKFVGEVERLLKQLKL